MLINPHRKGIHGDVNVRRILTEAMNKDGYENYFKFAYTFSSFKIMSIFGHNIYL
jgi:hypothetical protein